MLALVQPLPGKQHPVHLLTYHAVGRDGRTEHRIRCLLWRLEVLGLQGGAVHEGPGRESHVGGHPYPAVL